jgi:hypothetical protein
MKTIRLLGAALIVSALLFGCSEDDLSPGTKSETLLTPPSPSGSRVQYFDFEATVSDINVTGQNVKWYIYNPNNPSIHTISETDEYLENSDYPSTLNPQLPPTFKVKNRGTYYATQTVGGIESNEALSVTTILISR